MIPGESSNAYHVSDSQFSSGTSNQQQPFVFAEDFEDMDIGSSSAGMANLNFSNGTGESCVKSSNSGCCNHLLSNDRFDCGSNSVHHGDCNVSSSNFCCQTCTNAFNSNYFLKPDSSSVIKASILAAAAMATSSRLTGSNNGAYYHRVGENHNLLENQLYDTNYNFGLSKCQSLNDEPSSDY